MELINLRGLVDSALITQTSTFAVYMTTKAMFILQSATSAFIRCGLLFVDLFESVIFLSFEIANHMSEVISFQVLSSESNCYHMLHIVAFGSFYNVTVPLFD